MCVQMIQMITFKSVCFLNYLWRATDLKLLTPSDGEVCPLQTQTFDDDDYIVTSGKLIYSIDIGHLMLYMGHTAHRKILLSAIVMNIELKVVLWEHYYNWMKQYI